LIQGQAFGNRVRTPFLYDYAANIRLLLTVPILIIAETIVDPRLRHAVQYFVNSGLVQKRELVAFEETIRTANRLRDSAFISVLLILFAFGPSLWLRGKEIIGSEASTWHTVHSLGGQSVSLAGWWFALISIPLYRLLLFRWVWIIVLWTIFVRRIMKLRLYTVATHPDRAAGFGFLTHTQLSFALIAFAASALVAGGFANVLAYEGGSIHGLQFSMITSCVLIFAFMVAPLLVVTPKLFKVKEAGVFQYGALGTTYVQDFDSKWVRGAKPEDEQLLGTSDIQSLADLSNSFAIVDKMRVFLFDKEILVGIAIPVLFPMLVLLVIASPTEELIQAILKLLV